MLSRVKGLARHGFVSCAVTLLGVNNCIFNLPKCVEYIGGN